MRMCLRGVLACAVMACGSASTAFGQLNQPPLVERPAHLAAGDQGQRIWVSADYLLWQLDGVDLPAVATSSPAGTPLANAGIIGQQTTTVLAGNETVGDDLRSGLNLSGGIVLDPCGGWSLIGDYFWLGDDDYNYTVGPGTGVIIARPYFNSQIAQADAEFVEVPNELSGQLRVDAEDSLEGGGLALSKSLYYCCDACSGVSRRLSVIGGYRTYQYDSRLGFAEDLLVLPGTSTPIVVGTTINVRDEFNVRNQFHGGEVGLAARVQSCEWWIDGTALVAFGDMERTVTINGSTTNTVPNVGVSTASGGLLTSSETNIGRYVDRDAALIPRLRLGVGCQVTSNLSARCGYNLLVLTDVLQSVDVLPSAVDPRNLPPVQAGGGADPRFPGFHDSSVVAHGLDLGLMYSF